MNGPIRWRIRGASGTLNVLQLIAGVSQRSRRLGTQPCRASFLPFSTHPQHHQRQAARKVAVRVVGRPRPLGNSAGTSGARSRRARRRRQVRRRGLACPAQPGAALRRRQGAQRGPGRDERPRRRQPAGRGQSCCRHRCDSCRRVCERGGTREGPPEPWFGRGHVLRRPDAQHPGRRSGIAR